MTINATAPILLSLYAAVGEQQGVPLEKLSGTVQNDILKEYIARGTYIYPPRESLRLITDVFAFCAKRVPRWNPISISGYHIREAGSTAAQEIAFTLGERHRLRRGGRAAGLEVDAFAGRLSFFFNVHNNFLEEVAKFRAARRLWARVMKERFKAKDPRARCCASTPRPRARRSPRSSRDNNVVRVALQAMAAVLGGTQSLHTNCRDEALALPSRGGGAAGAAHAADHRPRDRRGRRRRSARRQLHGGAAHRRARGAGRGATSARSTRWAGWWRPSPQGYPQQEIQDAAYRAQRELETKRVGGGGGERVPRGGASARGPPARQRDGGAGAGRATGGAAEGARRRVGAAAAGRAPAGGEGPSGRTWSRSSSTR